MTREGKKWQQGVKFKEQNRTWSLLRSWVIISLRVWTNAKTNQNISYTHLSYHQLLIMLLVLQCFTNVSKFAFLSSSLLRCRSSQCEQGVEVCTLQGQRHDWGQPILQPILVAVFTLYRAAQVCMNPVGRQGICFLMASKRGTVHPCFFTSPIFQVMGVELY